MTTTVSTGFCQSVAQRFQVRPPWAVLKNCRDATRSEWIGDPQREKAFNCVLQGTCVTSRVIFMERERERESQHRPQGHQ